MRAVRELFGRARTDVPGIHDDEIYRITLVHSLSHSRPFSLSVLHDTGLHSVSCIGPVAREVFPVLF